MARHSLRGTRSDPRGPNYKWIALSNCTLGVLLATLDASITLIAMPNIFRGIRLDPLVPANSFYLLWMILGFLVVSSVLIVSLGRLGDMYGRVRIYNLGFVIYTVASLILTVDWLTGRDGALFLIVFRVIQGIGAACLLANSAAIITDAFPANQRGMALGINNIVGVSGMFVGLVLGGLLAPINWRLVFLISVPVGLFGTVWAYLKLQELSDATARPDRLAREHQLRTRADPGHDRGHLRDPALRQLRHRMGESQGAHPHRLRAGIAGRVHDRGAARGGPDVPAAAVQDPRVHVRHPLHVPVGGGARWADVHADHLAAGHLAAPARLRLHRHPAVGGDLHPAADDRDAARRSHLRLPVGSVRCSRPFATGGMVGAAISFLLLALLPTDFAYPVFAAVLFLNGVSMGLFASPNRAAVMNSLPPSDRGAGGGMNQTFQNSAQVLSIGIFFTLMIIGLASTLPHAMASGLQAHGVPAHTAQVAAHLPPVSILFAAFLGYNPIEHLLGSGVLTHLTHAQQSLLTGRSFFPHLISAPFRDGLHEAFAFAIMACLVAAAASWFRGGKPVATSEPPSEAAREHRARPRGEQHAGATIAR